MGTVPSGPSAFTTPDHRGKQKTSLFSQCSMWTCTRTCVRNTLTCVYKYAHSRYLSRHTHIIRACTLTEYTQICTQIESSSSFSPKCHLYKCPQPNFSGRNAVSRSYHHPSIGPQSYVVWEDLFRRLCYFYTWQSAQPSP